MFGLRAEYSLALHYRAQGRTVQMATPGAPFDLVVDGRLVQVKASRPRTSSARPSRRWRWNLHPSQLTECPQYHTLVLLECSGDAIEALYTIPANAVPQQRYLRTSRVLRQYRQEVTIPLLPIEHWLDAQDAALAYAADVRTKAHGPA